jgi:hypothetical protein
MKEERAQGQRKWKSSEEWSKQRDVFYRYITQSNYLELLELLLEYQK